MVVMRRGWRWMLNGVTAVSVVLALAVAGLWVGSYWRALFVAATNDATLKIRGVHVCQGRVLFSSFKIRGTSPATFNSWYAEYPKFRGLIYKLDAIQPQSLSCKHNFLGFGWAFSEKLRIAEVKAYFVIPFWFFQFLIVALPAIRLFGFLRRNRPVPGHCLTCGYDLRATPDRCPECGTVTAKDVGSALADGIVGKRAAHHPHDSAR